ncbi:MAG TPA: hypothetical protein VHD33_07800 [Legionellaceae bacterium]|nr:hypothetical protein [Legionellaceae bacterium]
MAILIDLDAKYKLGSRIFKANAAKFCKINTHFFAYVLCFIERYPYDLNGARDLYYRHKRATHTFWIFVVRIDEFAWLTLNSDKFLTTIRSFV